MSERYPLEGWVGLKAEAHRPDEKRGGCTCGFCAWSVEHVAIMAYRDAVDSAPTAPDSTPTEREAGDVGEVAALLAREISVVLKPSHTLACPSGSIDVCECPARAKVEALAPLIAERERAAGARALREAADEQEAMCDTFRDQSLPGLRNRRAWVDWLRDRAAALDGEA